MSSSLRRSVLASALAMTTASHSAVTAAKERQEEAAVKIQMTIEDEVLNATLVDNAATRDFVSLLPLTLTLRDYAGTEKVSELPSRLSTKGAPSGVDPTVGDITYYAPWGNLAIFYREFDFAKGLVKLGHLDAGVEKLARKRGEFSVRFERKGGSP